MVGLVLRFLLIPSSGFEADVAFWKSWSLAAADHDIIWMTQNTNNNYPPAFGYILWLVGKGYSLIGNPHDFNDYWSSTNFRFLLVTKLIPILSDIGITFGIYWFLSNASIYSSSDPNSIGKVEKSKLGPINKFSTSSNSKNHILLPLLGASMYFLHPVAILDGAWWGQVDSFGVLFLLLSLFFLFKKRPGLSVFIIVLGFLFKLQNIIYIPLLILYIARTSGISGLKQGALGAFVAWILGTIPFLLAHKVDTTLYLLGANADWFPWLSLHAYNLWWIVAKGDGMGYSDKFLLWGALTPKNIGLLLFASSYLVSVLTIMLKPKPKFLLLSLFLAVFSFFMLLTQSHERYIFPVFVLFPLFLPFVFQQKNHKYWVIGLLAYWVILSLTSTYDIHRTLQYNYPHNALPLLSLLNHVPLTIVASYLNVLLYLLSLLVVVLSTSIWVLPIVSLVLLVGLFVKNYQYAVIGKVPLSTLKSSGWYQEYSGPQQNLAVSSFGGPYTWTRLSSLYFFYPRGIGTHAKSEITYEIMGKFRRLSTDFGVDTEAGTLASVVFQIIGDDKVLFTSPKLGRFDLPQHKDVNIEGVKILKLAVLPTDDGNNSDHADWLNPLLYR